MSVVQLGSVESVVVEPLDDDGSEDDDSEDDPDPDDEPDDQLEHDVVVPKTPSPVNASDEMN